MKENALHLLRQQLKKYYELINPEIENLNTAVNDIYVITTPNDKFALKLYNTASRKLSDLQWELDLLLDLISKNVPVVKPVKAKNGYINTYSIDQQERLGILFEWAKGEKPKAEKNTYIILGKAAAQIHHAADSFQSNIDRDKYDIYTLMDDQLKRMKQHFIEANQWKNLSALADRLKDRITRKSLDEGICHMDLTLDNVHLDGNKLTVFDFDSAGKSWRALEPHGVLKFSKEYFNDWLEGYRSVRDFSVEDEKAVSAFVIIGDLRIVAWKLGVATSSRGKPLLTSDDLPKIVEEWLSWE